jgi:proteasome lid subunit RPN8/RPN11
MSFWKKIRAIFKRRSSGGPSAGPESGASVDWSREESPDVSAGAWSNRDKVVRRKFPGPASADSLLRIAMDRQAYADVTHHAKESLDLEVCGVLIGDVCEDDRGEYIHVRAIIRGGSTKSGGAHVTFTHETWNQIHDELMRDHPKLSVLGWYHSHPGFGVEFSDMDVFIQKNFFASPTQIALVIDPLGGDTAVAVNTKDGFRYIGELWVDGRSVSGYVPPAASSAASPGTPGELVATNESLQSMETRINQLVFAVEDLHASMYRFLMSVGITVGFIAILGIGFLVYRDITKEHRPPELQPWIPMPVLINDRPYYIGIQPVTYPMPIKLDEKTLNMMQNADSLEAMKNRLKAIDPGQKQPKQKSE